MQLLAGTLDAHELESSVILRQAGIDPSTLADPHFRVSLDKVCRLLDLASAALKNTLLGIQIGDQVKPHTRGLFGYVLLNAPSVKIAIDDYVRFVSFFRQGLDLKLHIQGENCDFTMDYDDRELKGHRLHIDCHTAIAINMLRALIGESWSPDFIKFQYEAPDEDIAALTEYFGCRLIFGQPENVIRFPTAILDTRPLTADDSMYQFLKTTADDKVGQLSLDQYPISQLRSLIQSNLHHGSYSIQEAAGYLAISKRTLQRALSARGTSFRVLKDRIRLEMATELLRNPNLSLSEVAFLIGYADASAFNHAFRRWTQLTPSEYRNTLDGISDPPSR